jgi:hypothetical protein
MNYQVKIMKNEEQKQVSQIFNLNDVAWLTIKAIYIQLLHFYVRGTKSIAIDRSKENESVSCNKLTAVDKKTYLQ